MAPHRATQIFLQQKVHRIWTVTIWKLSSDAASVCHFYLLRLPPPINTALLLSLRLKGAIKSHLSKKKKIKKKTMYLVRIFVFLFPLSLLLLFALAFPLSKSEDWNHRSLCFLSISFWKFEIRSLFSPHSLNLSSRFYPFQAPLLFFFSLFLWFFQLCFFSF